MNIKNKKYNNNILRIVVLVITLFFIYGLNCIEINATETRIVGYVPTDIKYTDEKLDEMTLYKNENGKDSEGAVGETFGKLAQVLREEYSKKTQILFNPEEVHENDFIAKVKFSGILYEWVEEEVEKADGTSEKEGFWKKADFTETEYILTDIDDLVSELNHRLNSGQAVHGRNPKIYLELEIGSTTYQMNTKWPYIVNSLYSKEDASSYEDRSDRVTGFNNMMAGIQKLADGGFIGLVEGGVSAGYNVGTPYSDKQAPLSTLMEETDNGYDFKPYSGIKYTFDYFIHPFVGKVYLDKEPFVPKTEEEWIEIAKATKENFIKGGTIQEHPEYLTFSSNISEEKLNNRGEKISKATIPNSVKAFNSSTAKNPKTVVSYNVRVAVPYMFAVRGGRAQLISERLREITEVRLCLYNDMLYSEEVDSKTNLPKEIGNIEKIMNKGTDSRNFLYLYRERNFEDVSTEEKPNDYKITNKGLVIVACFDEAVVDIGNYQSGSKEENIYLTGRKIGFDNGYSDSLDYLHENSEVLFVEGEDAGRQGYKPFNIAFPMFGTNLDNIIVNNLLASPALIKEEKREEYKKIIENIDNEVNKYKEKGNMLDYVNNQKMDDITDNLAINTVHGDITDKTQYFYVFINFGKITRNKIWDDSSYLKDSEQESEFIDKPTTDKSTEEPSDDETSDEFSGYKEGEKPSFYIIRNNKYIQDESLINWLKSNKAESISYVNAKVLLNKITGNFTGSLDELTYADWRAMQNIKSELDSDKDRVLFDIINIVCMLSGIFFMTFAVVIILAYWVDSFNTFTDFSFLEKISMGRLYPILEEDSEMYVPTRGEGNKVKFVTFKNVLFISICLVALGILMLNITVIVRFIISVFNYILYVAKI